MFPFKMRNFSLTLLFAVIVGIVGDSGKVWERNSATRNVIGFMNEVIEKPERMNEATGRQKLKSAGNGRACNAGYKLQANGLVCVPVCAKECVNAYCYLPNFCRCLDGYDKKHVNSNVCLPACPDGCSNGHCIAPNTCVCLPGYTPSLLTGQCLPLCKNRCENGYCHKPNREPGRTARRQLQAEMSAFPGSDTRLNTTNFLIREVAPVSMFSDNQQLVKTNPSNETPQNKFTGVKDTPNSFNRELNPIIKVLQVSGIIPITKTPRGMWVFSPLSPLMIYSVCLYFTMLVILWFTTGVRLQELMATHRHFNVMFFVFMAVSYFLIILAIPVINWPEANNIARYLSSWARFQEKYSKMTGRPLSLGLRRKVFIIMCVLPVLIFSFEVIYQLTNGDDVWVDWWVAVKEWYLDVVRFYVVTFWHLTCGALSSAAGSLWRNFRKECEESPRRVLQIIDTHRELWVQLSRLVRQTGCAMTYTYGFYILYMFLSLTFFVYHTMSNLARQLRADQVLMAIECCVMEYTLYLICNAANNASRDVGDEIRDGLLEARWSCNDKAVQKEFDKFLKTMDIFPPVVSLGDFTVINRTLFISLGTMMTTYLIVLLQFNMSSSDSQGYNITLQI